MGVPAGIAGAFLSVTFVVSFDGVPRAFWSAAQTIAVIAKRIVNTRIMIRFIIKTSL
jgi:hypothetical protein